MLLSKARAVFGDPTVGTPQRAARVHLYCYAPMVRERSGALDRGKPPLRAAEHGQQWLRQISIH